MDPSEISYKKINFQIELKGNLQYFNKLDCDEGKYVLKNTVILRENRVWVSLLKTAEDLTHVSFTPKLTLWLKKS